MGSKQTGPAEVSCFYSGKTMNVKKAITGAVIFL